MKNKPRIKALIVGLSFWLFGAFLIGLGFMIDSIDVQLAEAITNSQSMMMLTLMGALSMVAGVTGSQIVLEGKNGK